MCRRRTTEAPAAPWSAEHARRSRRACMSGRRHARSLDVSRKGWRAYRAARRPRASDQRRRGGARRSLRRAWRRSHGDLVRRGRTSVRRPRPRPARLSARLDAVTLGALSKLARAGAEGPGHDRLARQKIRPASVLGPRSGGDTWKSFLRPAPKRCDAICCEGGAPASGSRTASSPCRWSSGDCFSRPRIITHETNCSRRRPGLL